MEQLLIFLSFTTIISSLMTISSINPIHSVFWLVMVFINSSGFLILINFEFISLMIIIIYVGAITIIFLFVIMMLDIIQTKATYSINNIVPIILLISINIIINTWWILENKFIVNMNIFINNWEFNYLSQINTLAILLYTEYSIPFIILSVLLLVAMIGAIVLTLELGKITRRQSLSNQHQRNNSWI